MKEIYNILPDKIANIIKNNCNEDLVTEIRLRASRPIIVYESKQERVCNLIVELEDFKEILAKISNNSIYAIQKELIQGYLTVKDGHRIGVCGEVVFENNQIINVKNINSMNIRVASQKIGVARKVIDYIISENKVQNTLIVSPPGMGKTTMLRDISRYISDGVYDIGFKGTNVGIVDERSEIAACFNGISYLDVGMRTDIISNVSKAKGIEMLVRTMGIKVIITDEIGSKEDAEAIKYAAISGVKCIFTMHGDSVEDVFKKNEINELIKSGIFSTVIILSNRRGIGTIEKVHKLVPHSLKEVVS